MKEGRYRQCGLAQDNARTVGWIEERGAILGARVEIEELGGLWLVTGVGETAHSKAEMREAEARGRQSFTALKSYRGNK
jgi:hypothetical protein